MTLNRATSALSLVPSGNAYGKTTVEVEVSDGDDKAKTEVKVVVNPVNDRPTVTVALPTQGSSVMGNVTFSGKADDVENTLERVEFRVGEEGPWTPVVGTTGWTHVWDTAGLENGPVTLTFRSFDGELFSENVTVNVNVNNPVNTAPTVTITYPADGSSVPWGEMTVFGTSDDTDGEVRRVEIMVGDDPQWLHIKDDVSGLDMWSYTLNNSAWAGGELVIRVMSFDGNDRSAEVNITISVEEREGSPEQRDMNVPDTASQFSDLLMWLWILVAIAVVATILVTLVILLYLRKRRKDREREEEEEDAKRKEEEMRETEERTRALERQLMMAQPSGPQAAGTVASPAGASPLPAPPAPAPLAGAGAYAPLAQSPTEGAEYQLPLPPILGGGGSEIPLLPPAPSGVSPPPPPPVASADGGLATPGQVSCYNCGGMVPVPPGPGPKSIQCPACGALGEI